MKRISNIAIIFALILFSQYSFAQKSRDIVTEKVQVSGNCDMCKKRIEAAAYIPGVKRAEWDEHTKELTVTYKTSKANLQNIEQSIANKGYDAGAIKATDEAYESLPSCCAYRNGAVCKDAH